jgi:hypothetical protein
LAEKFKAPHHDKPAKGSLLGGDLVMKGATEPTNIIWENRHWTEWDTSIRYVIGLIMILILLGISLVIIW